MMGQGSDSDGMWEGRGWDGTGGRGQGVRVMSLLLCTVFEESV